MENAGYEITKKEQISGMEHTAKEYVVFGVMKGTFGMQYVTWTAIERNGEWNYFWGHYFDNENKALIDYHKRILSYIEDDE